MIHLTSIYTYTSVWGMSSVMLPLVFSPYFRYPSNPTTVYKTEMGNIEALSTPNTLPNFLGFFISFSSGKTCTKNRINALFNIMERNIVDYISNCELVNAIKLSLLRQVNIKYAML